MLKSLEEKAKRYLEILKVEVPRIENSIPRMDFSEAISVLREVYGKENLEDDLDPESEKLICSYVKEKFNITFQFISFFVIFVRLTLFFFLFVFWFLFKVIFFKHFKINYFVINTKITK